MKYIVATNLEHLRTIMLARNAAFSKERNRRALADNGQMYKGGLSDLRALFFNAITVHLSA